MRGLVVLADVVATRCGRNPSSLCASVKQHDASARSTEFHPRRHAERPSMAPAKSRRWRIANQAGAGR
jgi:hypothetical protein